MEEAVAAASAFFTTERYVAFFTTERHVSFFTTEHTEETEGREVLQQLG